MRQHVWLVLFIFFLIGSEIGRQGVETTAKREGKTVTED
jgi:hypothetical protein